MANTSRRSGQHNKPANIIENGRIFAEAVRSRAYALYESRGKEDGHDLDDWLLAEEQVLRLAAQTRRSSAA